jgi:uncharacterized protein YwgA
MDRYQLATLSLWAGDLGIQGRKRLQKVVFFLQAAGCPLGSRFTLHHYGPYSRDVADTCDEMVAMGLLKEEVAANVTGAQQYSYHLTEGAKNLLATTTAQETARAAAVAPFRELGARLLREDLWKLELGSTILFFYEQTPDWDDALRRACEFKRVPTDVPATIAALRLAQEVSLKGVAHPT